MANNNGIYGRFSNSTEAFSFLVPLHSHSALLRSGHITDGHALPDLAGPSPKLFASLTTPISRFE